MHQANGDRTFANSGRDSLHRAVTDVANGEHPRRACSRRKGARPSVQRSSMFGPVSPARNMGPGDGVVCQKVGTTRSCCWPATAGNVTGADFVIDGGMVTTL